MGRRRRREDRVDCTRLYSVYSVYSGVQHNIITTVYRPSLIPSVLSSGGLRNNTVDERPKSETDSKEGDRALSRETGEGSDLSEIFGWLVAIVCLGASLI